MLYLAIDHEGIQQARRYCAALGCINSPIVDIRGQEDKKLPTLHQLWLIMSAPNNKDQIIACADKLKMKKYLGKVINLNPLAINWPEGGVYAMWPRLVQGINQVCRLNIDGGLDRVSNGYTPASLYPTENKEFYQINV